MGRCPDCSAWAASITAATPVACNDELVVNEDACVLGDREAEWPLEMAFDGGAREVNGRRVAGVGAIIWGADVTGKGRRIVARAVIGLPGQAHAQVAEAYGCRIGLQMLADPQRRLRAARVAGDNLNVVRYCASGGGDLGDHASKNSWKGRSGTLPQEDG